MEELIFLSACWVIFALACVIAGLAGRLSAYREVERRLRAAKRRRIAGVRLM